MIRKILGTCAVAAFLMLSLAGLSNATTTPYPAPPVTTAISVLPTSNALVITPPSAVTVVSTTAQAAPANPLAYTGSGVNVGLTVAIGVFVVLLGIGLVVLGGRRAFGRPNQHS